MIEFNGNISGKCLSYILNVERKIGFISALIPTLLIGPIIFIAIFIWHWIFFIAIPILLLFIIFATIKPNKKNYDIIMPTRIIIYENIIISESNKFHITRSLDYIKNIKDMGEWYQFNFKFPHKSSKFICQKQLIVNGTVQEFEKKFEKKIIYMNNK